MNPGMALLVAGFGIKRLLAVIVVTMVVVVTLPVIVVFSIGTPTLDWLANTPSAAAAETQGFYMGPPMPGNTYAWGNCTWWAYAMRLWAGSPIPTRWGNANTWDNNAERDGYIVNRIPAVSAIFQNDNDGGGYGHVAYVIAVDPRNGDWTISEMNAPTLNVVSTRTFSSEAAKYYKFIHNKLGAEEWIPESLLPIPSLNIGT